MQTHILPEDHSFRAYLYPKPTMRNFTAALLLAFVAAVLPSLPGPASAQTLTCYKKKCLEYEDGTKICELTPVDCSQVKML